MEFKVSELEREPIEFDLELAPGAVDLGEEAEQVGRSGHLRTGRGAARASRAEGDCRRYPAAGAVSRADFRFPARAAWSRSRFRWQSDFDLIFRPVGADADATERSITAPETEIGYYQKDSLLLEDVLREQVLLSLPVRTLCKPDCKGLCPRCGQNRNSQACSCDEGPSDPRWEALAGLRSRIKS